MTLAPPLVAFNRQVVNFKVSNTSRIKSRAPAFHTKSVISRERKKEQKKTVTEKDLNIHSELFKKNLIIVQLTHMLDFWISVVGIFLSCYVWPLLLLLF